MMEMVFSESACGSLKMAQRYGEGPHPLVSFGFVGVKEDGNRPTEAEMEALRRELEEKDRRRWEAATPMGGDPGDVYGLVLGLSVGDIAEDEPGPLRRQALARLFGIYPWSDRQGMVDNLIEGAEDTLLAVRRRASAGEAIRIWYSHSPDELCGLYWLMARLEAMGAEPPLSLVRLPDWEMDEQGEDILHSTRWGEMEPGAWHRYLPLAQPAPLLFRRACAARWRALQRENAPLRAVVSGQLVSVPESFYDPFILREIAAEGEEFHEAMVVGRVLSNYQLGIGDALIAHRIEAMVAEGLLEPVSEAPEDSPIYHRRLRKCGV